MSDDDNGLWYDEDCEQLYPVICERMRDGETAPPTTITNPGGSCADGWFVFGDHCYQVCCGLVLVTTAIRFVGDSSTIELENATFGDDD